MRPLVAVRRATPFDAARLQVAELWPLRTALHRLGPLASFPSWGTLDRVFEGDAPVRFVAAPPRPRRRVAPVDPASLYDGRIALDRHVPTRVGCWHDLMNALVWGTFPRAKLALHTRQHRVISARLPRGARALPPTRTRELDALALVDEGGVVVLARDPAPVRAALRTGPGALREAVARGDCEAVAFGHALFESHVLGVSPAAVAAVVLPSAARGGELLSRIDVGLSEALADDARFQSPDEMCRVEVSELLAPPDYLTTQMLMGLACS